MIGRLIVYDWNCLLNGPFWRFSCIIKCDPFFQFVYSPLRNANKSHIYDAKEGKSTIPNPFLTNLFFNFTSFLKKAWPKTDLLGGLRPPKPPLVRSLFIYIWQMLGLRPKPHTSFKKRSKRGGTPLKGGPTPSFLISEMKVNRTRAGGRACPRTRVPAGTLFTPAGVTFARGQI